MNVEIQQFLSSAFKLFTNPLFRVGDTSVSLTTIVELGLSLLAFIFLTRALKDFLKNRLFRKLGIDEGNRATLSTFVSNSIGAIVLIVALQSTGFNLASLAILAGGLGIGIGFGLQNVTKDFVSGLTLLIEHKLKVGDFVMLENNLSGHIREIAMRSTLIRTLDGGYVVVPNSKLVENQLLNWTYDSPVVRIRVPVGVAYGSDPVLVTELLLKSAYMETSVLRDPRPEVIFKGFGDSALNFELWVWIARIDREPQIKSALNFLIEQNLRTAEIHIPFPQRDLWLRNPEALLGNSHHRQETAALPQPSQPLEPSESSQTHPPKSSVKARSLQSLLRQVDYFTNFTDIELRQLIEIGFRKRLTPSEILFREGDPGNAFYIILFGSVEVFSEKLNKQISILRTGRFLGELALMLGIPRTATVRALENTVLFAIDKKGFEKLLHSHPELSEAIARELGNRREELSLRQQELREMGLLDATEDDSNPVLWMRKRLKKMFGLYYFT